MDTAWRKFSIDGFKEISRLSYVVSVYLMRDIDKAKVGVEVEDSPFQHGAVMVLSPKIGYNSDGFHRCLKQPKCRLFSIYDRFHIFDKWSH